MKESRSGYQQLGIQAAELIKAIARVLEQGKQDETSIMKDNVEDLRRCAYPTSQISLALRLEPPACSERSRLPSTSGFCQITTPLFANATAFSH
jgi:hypothetical protein